MKKVTLKPGSLRRQAYCSFKGGGGSRSLWPPPLPNMDYNDHLIDRAIENVPLNRRGDIPRGGMNEFLSEVVDSFLVEKIKDFPKICAETRKVNAVMLRELTDHGNKTPTKYIAGKVYEGTTGWSKDKNFKHKWIVPSQLMFFMRNLVYRKFWDDDNHKVRDKFMKDILRGEDPLRILANVRANYGANSNKPSEQKVIGQTDIP